MFKRLISMSVLLTFWASVICPPNTVQAASLLGLPEPGQMVSLTSAYSPALIKGITLDPKNPFKFDFIIDTGKKIGDVPNLKAESTKLIKYFLTALTVPEQDLWVNLSPYEKNRTLPQNLGQTMMGRDMLAQDYILKQLTASLIYPEKELGKEFWKTVYAKAQQTYGTTEIPVNTFNKVWIVADKAEVYEHGQSAFVTGAHLKVMLESDYLAIEKNQRQPGDMSPKGPCPQADCQANEKTNTKAPQVNHQQQNEIIKDLIIPELEKEVNEGKNFAPLRQMFYSMILASWYKLALKDAALSKLYGNQSKVKGGVNTDDPSKINQIYERYVQAYKKGVFNYIKEEPVVSLPPVGRVREGGNTTPRKYFSGGLQMWGQSTVAAMITRQYDQPQIAQSFVDGLGTTITVTAAMNAPKQTSPTSTASTSAAMNTIRPIGDQARPATMSLQYADGNPQGVINQGLQSPYPLARAYAIELAAQNNLENLVLGQTIVELLQGVDAQEEINREVAVVTAGVIAQYPEKFSQHVNEANKVLNQGLHESSRIQLAVLTAIHHRSDKFLVNNISYTDVEQLLGLLTQIHGNNLPYKMAVFIDKNLDKFKDLPDLQEWAKQVLDFVQIKIESGRGNQLPADALYAVHYLIEREPRTVLEMAGALFETIMVPFDPYKTGTRALIEFINRQPASSVAPDTAKAVLIAGIRFSNPNLFSAAMTSAKDVTLPAGDTVAVRLNHDGAWNLDFILSGQVWLERKGQVITIYHDSLSEPLVLEDGRTIKEPLKVNGLNVLNVRREGKTVTFENMSPQKEERIAAIVSPEARVEEFKLVYREKFIGGNPVSHREEINFLENSNVSTYLNHHHDGTFSLSLKNNLKKENFPFMVTLGSNAKIAKAIAQSSTITILRALASASLEKVGEALPSQERWLEMARFVGMSLSADFLKSAAMITLKEVKEGIYEPLKQLGSSLKTRRTPTALLNSYYEAAFNGPNDLRLGQENSRALMWDIEKVLEDSSWSFRAPQEFENLKARVVQLEAKDGRLQENVSEHLEDALITADQSRFVPPAVNMEAMNQIAQGKNPQNTTGGIDLNAKNMGMTVSKDAQGGVKVNYDSAMISRMQSPDFVGLEPLIMGIHLTPMNRILPLLGLAPRQEQMKLAGV